MVVSEDRQGSGVIVRPNVVATNCHVVEDGDITVYKANNRRVDTTIVFTAVIRPVTLASRVLYEHHCNLQPHHSVR